MPIDDARSRLYLGTTGKLHQNQYDSGIWITNMQRSVDHGSKGTHLGDADNARRLHLSRFDGG
ncbi:hypothetical protein PISMIDRAFT_684127 [Pisolithus microcarpus 441]|uniref:Uncharacterized protein n=1 Tax=Pisolithus microcarpus 441 TaxID=765257 RepID=A0A0C9Y1C7_9AGAM|nr:hypothetical protein PISMIDRAFT_684127 [Pisolithus microcarpus 441]